MKKLYFLFALLTSWNLHAQTYEWTNTFGGVDVDNSYSIATDNSGNIYLAGTYAYDSVDFDPTAGVTRLPFDDGDNIFFAKYDANGDIIWVRSVHSNNNEQAYAMTLDHLGNIYITGYFYATVDFNPSPAVANLTITSSTPGIYLAKYDNNGNYIWAIAFDGSDIDQGFGVKADNTGNIYVTGQFQNTVDFDPSPSTVNLASFGGWDIFLAKFDAAGNYLWATNMGGSSDDFGKLMMVDALDNIYLNGAFAGIADFDPSTSVANLNSTTGGITYMAKYNSSGDYIWAKNIAANRTYGFEFDKFGNICISGYFSASGDFDPNAGTFTLTSNGGSDVFYAKYDNTGGLIWAKNFGGTGDDQCFGMAMDSSSNIYLTGGFKNTVDFDPGPGSSSSTATGTTYKDIFLVKYNHLGDFGWVRTVGAAGEDVGKGITVTNTGDIYQTGWFRNTVDFSTTISPDVHTSNGGQDIFLTKYSNPTTAIENAQESENSSFMIYPNPTNGNLFCQVAENTQLYIYSALGALAYKQLLSKGKNILNISSFFSGIYFVRLGLSTEGTILVKQ